MDKYFVYSDGGSRGNPGPAASGFVAYDEFGTKIGEARKYLGRATNNMAEYWGVLIGLDWIIKNICDDKKGKIIFHLDSLLVVNQLNGLYKIKNIDLQKMAIKVRELEGQIDKGIIYKYIPRDQNQFADRLVNQSLDELE
ncbi:ribonuclease HI family protein [Patescibacteria group bacterium]|nr:ribonuclease HI family protein [Patescibacteria group bacterium]